MGKSPGLPGEAGASAMDEWHRARASRRRRRPFTVGLWPIAAGLVALGIWRGDGRALAAGAAAVLGAWWCRADADPDRWRRGAEGEAATAVLLGRLPRRWMVLHDRRVPGSASNIDHLVIGPTGVWVVDTKAARARLRVSRGQVWAGDHPIDTGPAAWEAEVVSDRLGVVAVAVVAVHGDGLRRHGKLAGGVRVIPADRLVRRLRRCRRVLSRADVSELAKLAEEVFPPH